MAPGARERYERLKNTDEERNKLMQELLEANEGLKEKLDRATQRLERGTDIADMYQNRAKEAALRFETLQKLSNSGTYVCVLIDGEELSFNDNFTQGATLEGSNAARLLFGAIKEYVAGLGIRQDIDIVVHIYANMYALAKKFRDSHGDIDRFISGFNATYSLFSFIDSGNVQGSVQSKVGELFRLHIKNLHCKHVVLGVSTSDTYARLLETCVGGKRFKEWITILNGRPFSQELSRLSSHFKTTSFPQVFLSTMAQRPVESPQRYLSVLARAHAANHQAPEDRFLDSLDDDQRRLTTNGAAKYGGEEHRSLVDRERRSSLRDGAGARIHPDDDADAASRRSEQKKVYPPSYFTDAPFGFIARNRKGQRVDVPLSKPDSARIHDIKNRKICNDFVFRKKCHNDPCRHEHPTNLSEQEFHALRDVARSFPCSIGLRCNDVFCHSAHRCPVDPCGFVHDRNCRYPPELHETDTGIVNIEDYERVKSSFHDETHILGVTNKHSREPTHQNATISRSGEPLYRNLSVAFDNGTKSGSKKAANSPDSSSTLGKSILNVPARVSTSGSVSAATVIGGPISPMKRTADDTNELDHQWKLSVSPARDPRVGAQKRLRGLSP